MLGPEGLQELQHQAIWRSIIAKYESSEDQNAFMNSLTEDEFVEYIKEKTEEDLLEQFKLSQSKEDDLQTIEDHLAQYQKLMEQEQGDQEAQQTMTLEDAMEELKVFKDCTVTEFEDIFGAKPNLDLPLYVNLFKMREQASMFLLMETLSNKYTVPGVIAMNFAYYYQMKRLMPN